MMRRALNLARRGYPSPNPHVGAVLVNQGVVVGEGFHERAGLAHAEVVALQQAGKHARGATLYVSFEPCNHHGRTGPCTDAILAAQVQRVVIGCHDPVPHVPGAVEKLRARGLVVDIGVCEKQAELLVADFVHFQRHRQPFVTLKAALSMDGRIATATGDSRWITGKQARKHAHRLRDYSDAILVGVGTVLRDDPRLNVRHVHGRDPWRIVLDSQLRTPEQAKILQAARMPTLIVHDQNASAEQQARLRAAGAELLAVKSGVQGLDIAATLSFLAERDVVRLLVEGGSAVHGAFLQADLVQRLSLFYAPMMLGSDALPFALFRGAAKVAAASRFHCSEQRKFGEDWWVQSEYVHRDH